MKPASCLIVQGWTTMLRGVSLRQKTIAGVFALLTLTAMVVFDVRPTAADHGSFAFDIRRRGWSTYEHDYFGTGRPVNITFSQAGHDVFVKLISCDGRRDLTGDVYFPHPAERQGTKTMGTVRQSLCFKLTMSSRSFHIVRARGTIRK
jgi:hypothetical protein